MSKANLKQAIRFFFKLAIIVFLLFVTDMGIGSVMKVFYFRQQSGVGFRTTYAIDSTSADILVFGSSRASHSFVPEIFEERLSSTFFNTGRDGNFILYNYAIFRSVVNRYIPKMIIIEYDPEDLCYQTSEYDRLSLLLPYYKSHRDIRMIIDLRGPFEKIKNLSAVYPYNSLILQIVMGNMEFNKKRVPDIKGYVPLYKTMEAHNIDTSGYKKCTTDENKVNALKDLISSCRKNSIELIFVRTPVWNIVKDNSSVTRIDELLLQNGARSLNFVNHPLFIENPAFFADPLHLNDEGARLFSSMLLDSLEKPD